MRAAEARREHGLTRCSRGRGAFETALGARCGPLLVEPPGGGARSARSFSRLLFPFFLATSRQRAGQAMDQQRDRLSAVYNGKKLQLNFGPADPRKLAVFTRATLHQGFTRGQLMHRAGRGGVLAKLTENQESLRLRRRRGEDR